jgi:polyisoprenyl-phosphate glycosyltransferase
MILSIVIPCYNEEAVLPETARRLAALLDRLLATGKVDHGSRIYFVDDGSRDNTWNIIDQLASTDAQFGGIKLSRNQGHQNALVAGLFSVPGDAVVSMDADLQDDVNAVEAMLDSHRRGIDVVYGVRRQRNQDTMFKRWSAAVFYRLMDALGAESIRNHADYRLLSRRALEALKQFRETNLYLRGIVPLVGYRSEIVHYDRASRYAGETKYPLHKMLGLALNGVTSFSVVPLRLITVLGLIIFAGSLSVAVWAACAYFLFDATIPGWTSVVLPMYLLGGAQALFTGILGEYLGKIYAEVKDRPRYFVERMVGQEPAPQPAEVRIDDLSRDHCHAGQ